MKTFIRKTILSLILVLLSATSFGYEVKEIMRMEDAVQNVGAETLMVFDLDNTVIQSKQSLGSDQWFDYNIERLIKLGFDKEQALNKTKAEWVRINEASEVELVEQNTRYLIRDLQRRNVPVIALTARSLELLDRTIELVTEFGIDFGNQWGFGTIFKRAQFPGSAYDDGVIFAGGANKGIVLKAFLDQNRLKPSYVRLVDDKIKNVQAMGTEMDKHNIPFTGYRYGAADGRVKAFNPKIAEKQLEHFNKTGYLLSDKEAQRLIGGVERTGRQAEGM